MLCSVFLLFQKAEEISSGSSDKSFLSHCDTSKYDRLTKNKYCRAVLGSSHELFIGFWDVGISLKVNMSLHRN